MDVRWWYRHALVILLIAVNCSEESSNSLAPGTSASEFVGAGDYEGPYWPTENWRTCRPEEVGMSSQLLVRAYTYAANDELNTFGLAIIKDGYIVGEAYLNGFKQDDRRYSYSVCKSFASAVIGIAIDDGLIESVDENVYQYYAQWQEPGTDPRKQQMTIRHLLTMTSGLEWDEDNYYGNSSTNDAFIMHRQSDMIQYVLDKPMRENPGERWYYSTGNSQLLSGIIESVAGMSFYEYALPNLLEPIGLSQIGWDHDDAGHTHTGSGIRATVREYGKFGYLYLMNGQWDGEQIVSSEWIAESTAPVSESIDWYGYHWWLKPALGEPTSSIVPSETYIAWGIYTQQIFVIPSKNIVIVRVGDDPGGIAAWNEIRFLTLVLESIIN